MTDAKQAPDPATERMQRVRIGLTGLASVFLLVLLAAAFLGFVKNEPAIVTDARGNVVVANVAEPPGGEGGSPKEPLAELGVTPGNVPDQPASTANMTGPAPR